MIWLFHLPWFQITLARNSWGNERCLQTAANQSWKEALWPHLTNKASQHLHECSVFVLPWMLSQVQWWIRQIPVLAPNGSWQWMFRVTQHVSKKKLQWPSMLQRKCLAPTWMRPSPTSLIFKIRPSCGNRDRNSSMTGNIWQNMILKFQTRLSANLKWLLVLRRKIQSMRLARGCKDSELLNNSTLTSAALKIQNTAGEFNTEPILSASNKQQLFSYNQLSAIISYPTLSLSEIVWHCSRALLLRSLWLGWQAFQAWDNGPQVFKSASNELSQEISRPSCFVVSSLHTYIYIYSVHVILEIITYVYIYICHQILCIIYTHVFVCIYHIYLFTLHMYICYTLAKDDYVYVTMMNKSTLHPNSIPHIFLFSVSTLTSRDMSGSSMIEMLLLAEVPWIGPRRDDITTHMSAHM